MAKKNKFSNDINIKNRKSWYNYELLDRYVAGMVLKGTEIKSIRMGKVDLTDGHCFFEGNELFATGVHISPYELGSFYNHDPIRKRKLLLNKKELKKLRTKSAEKGLTIVPIRLFITQRGFSKMEISLAKGKKLHDKRNTLKEKDAKRELSKMKL